MKDIQGFEGLYAITSCGKVWSYRSKKFLKSNINRHGYEYVVLSVGSKRKTFTIHKLVAEAYIPNPKGLQQINHKDENKQHNYINNLEWCDANYNMNYGSRTQKTRKRVYCVELDREFDGVRVAANELGMASTNISRACKNEQFTCRGYHWRYVE